LPHTKSVEVCFSPKLFPDIVTTADFTVVLVDILRATTTICTAVGNGAEAIIPVETLEEARRLKGEGFLVASEKDGVQLDFADFGNSAFSFTTEAIAGKTLVYCTTNGTKALHVAAGAGSGSGDPAAHDGAAHAGGAAGTGGADDGGSANAGGRTRAGGARTVVIGAFINISALTEWLARRRQNVVVLCSGWKRKFCLEDTLFAGALTERLLATGLFRTECDSAHASLDLWNLAEGDVLGYMEKAAHRHRLKKLGLDDVIPYSFTFDEVSVVPVFDGETIRDTAQ
jgi:2-phosphosulfolactate phosphatase